MMLKKAVFFCVLINILACNNSLTEKERENYLTKGEEVAKSSFKELSRNLVEHMKQGGPLQAISFCNEQALPITDQLSEKYNVTIKRTSNKLRNTKNKPTEREKQIIDNYINLQKIEKNLMPIVEIDNTNKKHFYAPITIKANCLVCHGKIGEAVNAKTDSVINIFYPNDKATGYKEGDVRGIWSITFKN